MFAAGNDAPRTLPPAASILISLIAGGAILLVVILALHLRSPRKAEEEERSLWQAAQGALRESLAALERRDAARAEEAASRALLASEGLREDRDLTNEIRATAFLLRGKARALASEPDRLRQAIADFDRCLALTQRDFFALHCRGCARYRLGDAAAADQDLTAALALKPDYAPSYAARALVRRALKQESAAEADERRAQELEATQAASR